MSAQRISDVPLPRVNGRHRDKALATARKIRAVELKAQGLTYQQIADEMGYSSRSTAYTIIRTALANRLDAELEDYRDLEVSRLNALQAGLWDQALAGDIQAADTIRKLIETRCRLLGLHQEQRIEDPKEQWDNCQGPPTLLIRDDDCRHDGCPSHGRFA